MTYLTWHFLFLSTMVQKCMRANNRDVDDVDDEEETGITNLWQYQCCRCASVACFYPIGHRRCFRLLGPLRKRLVSPRRCERLGRMERPFLLQRPMTTKRPVVATPPPSALPSSSSSYGLKRRRWATAYAEHEELIYIHNSYSKCWLDSSD